jgi:hypothetical protein
VETACVTRATACSEPYEGVSSITLIDPEPAADAEDVPLDTAIAVTEERIGTPNVLGVTIEVTERETGSAVYGVFTPLYWGQYMGRFQPDEPLSAHTRYDVHVVANPDPEAGAANTDELDFSFTTGNLLTTALRLAGDIEVTLEQYERPDYDSCEPTEPCTNCTPTATLIDTRARVRLPAVSGGQVAFGYRAWVSVTADVPRGVESSDDPDAPRAHVLANGMTMLTPNEPGELIIDSLIATQSYQPCFTLEVTDLAGNSVTKSACPNIVVEANDEQGGCSLSPGPRVGTGLGGLLLLLGLLAAQRRRSARL